MRLTSYDERLLDQHKRFVNLTNRKQTIPPPYTPRKEDKHNKKKRKLLIDKNNPNKIGFIRVQSYTILHIAFCIIYTKQNQEKMFLHIVTVVRKV